MKAFVGVGRVPQSLFFALCASVVLLVSSHCGARTGLEIPPGPPTPDIECGTTTVPRMTFSLGFDDTFTSDPNVLRVTWNLRHRCLERTSDAQPGSTPGNCSRCFFRHTESLTVRQEAAHPLAFSPAGWTFYTMDRERVTPRLFTFDVVGAPSARWCVDGYVEFRDGRIIHFGPVTRLLTSSTHGDSGFMVTQRGGTIRVLPEFIADDTCFGR